MCALSWKPSEPGRTRGSSLSMNDTLLKQLMQAVKDSKTGAVETEMKAYLKEIGYEGTGAPSTVTYLINKKLRATDVPLKCGYSNNGKNIRFFRYDWSKEPPKPEEDDNEDQ